MKLRPFQKDAVSNIRAQLQAGVSRILLQSATGSGKTVIAGEFSSEYLSVASNKILVLLNLQVLIGQTYDTFKKFSLNPSVLHDEVTRNAEGERFPLQYDQLLITMPETFMNAKAGKNKLPFDQSWEPTLILIDEAHKGTSENYQIIRGYYPNAIILGLTATPYREKNEEGEHLREWYGDNLIVTTSVENLIAEGILVRPQYIELDPNTHVVNKWREVTTSSTIKNTIVFTRDTKHSVAMLEAFQAAGIAAEIITAVGDEDADIKQQTPLQRQEIYNRYNKGEIDVLISVSALCEGFDSQRAKFCFMCRSIGTHALYHQMIGRVLRAYENKDCAVIADFCGNYATHGPIEDYQWSLDDEGKTTKHLGTNRSLGFGEFIRRTSVTVRCVNCNHVYDIKKSSKCIHCGTAHKVQITNEFGDMLQALFPNANPQEARNSLYRALNMPGPGTAANANKVCGTEVFGPGFKLNPKYEMLKKPILWDKKLKERVTVPADSFAIGG